MSKEEKHQQALDKLEQLNKANKDACSKLSPKIKKFLSDDRFSPAAVATILWMIEEDYLYDAELDLFSKDNIDPWDIMNATLCILHDRVQLEINKNLRAKGYKV